MLTYEQKLSAFHAANPTSLCVLGYGLRINPAYTPI